MFSQKTKSEITFYWLAYVAGNVKMASKTAPNENPQETGRDETSLGGGDFKVALP